MATPHLHVELTASASFMEHFMAFHHLYSNLAEAANGTLRHGTNATTAPRHIWLFPCSSTVRCIFESSREKWCDVVAVHMTCSWLHMIKDIRSAAGAHHAQHAFAEIEKKTPRMLKKMCVLCPCVLSVHGVQYLQSVEKVVWV